MAVELTSAGYNAITVEEAGSIREKIKVSSPDLVLLDLYMRGTHRWDVLMDIKKENPNLPVLIVTAFDDYRNNPRLSLADGYFIKSFCFDDLIQRIRETLRAKGRILSQKEE